MPTCNHPGRMEKRGSSQSFQSTSVAHLWSAFATASLSVWGIKSLQRALWIHPPWRMTCLFIASSGCVSCQMHILRIFILDNTNSQCIGPFTMLGQHPLVLALIDFLQMLCSDFLKEIMYSKIITSIWQACFLVVYRLPSFHVWVLTVYKGFCTTDCDKHTSSTLTSIPLESKL